MVRLIANNQTKRLLEHECALAVHPFESSVSVGHRQSHAYLARLTGHRRQQYRGRASHRLVARGAVQTTRARHRLLQTVTHPVLTAPQYLRGSDQKPNRRNQRSAGALRRSHAHHPHLAFQTGPIKRTLGLPSLPSEA